MKIGHYFMHRHSQEHARNVEFVQGWPAHCSIMNNPCKNAHWSLKSPSLALTSLGDSHTLATHTFVSQ